MKLPFLVTFLAVAATLGVDSREIGPLAAPVPASQPELPNVRPGPIERPVAAIDTETEFDFESDGLLNDDADRQVTASPSPSPSCPPTHKRRGRKCIPVRRNKRRKRRRPGCGKLIRIRRRCYKDRGLRGLRFKFGVFCPDDSVRIRRWCYSLCPWGFVINPKQKKRCKGIIINL